MKDDSLAYCKSQQLLGGRTQKKGKKVMPWIRSKEESSAVEVSRKLHWEEQEEQERQEGQRARRMK